MPRAAITPFDPPSFQSLPVGVGALDVTLVASDHTNGNSVPHTGREVILAQGTGTITVASAPDSLGRTGDVATYAVSAAPKVSVIGPFPVEGWRQSDGTLHIDTSANTVLLAVVSLPTLE